MTGETITHYHIVDKIGEGGMGVVYRATDTRLGRQVALKFLSPRLSTDPVAIERFEREARAASSINHPHICAVYDIGRYRDAPFLVMELLDGITLRRRIGGQALPTETVLDLGAQIADALDAAHAHNIVHRDIKATNIFLTDRGHIKILDFGLAKLASSRGGALDSSAATTLADNTPDLTGPDQVVGTLASMSPEQARGDELDARSDLFSFGVVLYEMATGREPFTGRTPAMVLSAILTEAPRPASDSNPRIPVGLDSIIAKALCKPRDQRYQSAATLRADLERLRRTDATTPAVTPSAKSTWTSTGTRWLLALAALVLVSLAVVVEHSGVADRGKSGPHLATLHSVAVVPLASDFGDSDAQLLTDGITETLISGLRRFSPGLRVAARSVVFKYKGKIVDPRQVGRDLKVDAVITGRTVNQGGRPMLRVELQDVVAGSLLWAGDYDSRSSPSVIANDIMDKSLAKLQPNLSDADRKRGTNGHTESPEALRLYVQGRHELDRGTLPGNKAAIEYFQRAVQTDSQFGLAYAALADGYLAMVSYSADPIFSAKSAAEEALRIDPNLAEAHVALGDIKAWLYWDWPAAQHEFERAIALDPYSALPHSRYAMMLATTGRVADAIAESQLALNAEPVSPSVMSDYGWHLLRFGRYLDAIAKFRAAIDFDPDWVSAHHGLGTAYSLAGRHDEAVGELKHALQLAENSPIVLGDLGAAYARQQKLAEAQRVLRELQDLSLHEDVPSSALAIVYATIGDRVRALDWLEKALDEHDFALAQLMAAPWLRTVHDDPRFEKLMVKLNLPR